MNDRMGAWRRRHVLGGIIGASAALAAPAIVRAAPSGQPVKVGGTLSLTGFLAQTAVIHKIAAEINKASDGTYRLAAVYRNEPKLSVRDRSPIHYGAFVLDVQGDPAKDLVGHYWTDRNTRGEVRTLARHGSIASSFKEARTLLPPDAETAQGAASERQALL